jgi:four helix bundle protein
VTSIPANIAEGYGGLRSGKAYQNYLIIARRSVNETDYWILLAHDLEYIKRETYHPLEGDCREIIMILSKIISKLEARKAKNYH